MLLNHLNDERLVTTLSVISGVQLGDNMMDTDPPNDFSNFSKPSPTPSSSNPPPEPEPECPQNVKEAKQQKELGNDAYKKKNFEKALEHYNKALSLDPIDITYYNNIAAVYFEQKEYEKCIEQCEKGIEIGRENRADFKLIAKAFTRIGNDSFCNLIHVFFYYSFLHCFLKETPTKRKKNGNLQRPITKNLCQNTELLRSKLC